MTCWALEQGSDVIAVEPDPVAVASLRKRVPESVEIWEGAVAPTAGTTRLVAHRDRFGMSGSRLNPEGKVEVRTWTLPEILGDRRPTLVKVDIEGYEIELLPTIAPYLAKLGASMQVALHGTLPDSDWLSGFGSVEMPEDPHCTIVARA